MPSPNSERITFSFTPRPGALAKDVSMNLAVAAGTEPGLDTAVFMGLGNEGYAARRAAKHLVRAGLGEKSVAIVQSLPYWHAEPDEVGITHMAVTASEAVAEHLRDSHAVEDLHIVGESQAGPGALFAADELPELYDGRVALLRSLGLQGPISPAKFVWRMARSGLQLDQLLAPGTIPIVMRSNYRVAQDALRGGDQLKFALNFDATDPLKKVVARGKEVAVFTTDRDLVFPTEEVRYTIGKAGIRCVQREISGSHSSPASKAGARQLIPVLDWLRTA